MEQQQLTAFKFALHAVMLILALHIPDRHCLSFDYSMSCSALGCSALYLA